MLSDRTEAEFKLPWPVSVNHAWRAINIGRYAEVKLSKQGRDYRKSVIAHVSDAIGQLREPLFQSYIGIAVYFFPPDNRNRDIDNYNKTLLDAITKAKVWSDDSLIKQQQSYWCESITPKKCPELNMKGMALVRIWELPEWEPMTLDEVVGYQYQQKIQTEESPLDFGID